jgi:hypothetical protein
MTPKSGLALLPLAAAPPRHPHRGDQAARRFGSAFLTQGAGVLLRGGEPASTWRSPGLRQDPEGRAEGRPRDGWVASALLENKDHRRALTQPQASPGDRFHPGVFRPTSYTVSHAGVATLEDLKAERVGTIAGTSMRGAPPAGLPPRTRASRPASYRRAAQRQGHGGGVVARGRDAGSAPRRLARPSWAAGEPFTASARGPGPARGLNQHLQVVRPAAPGTG